MNIWFIAAGVASVIAAVLTVVLVLNPASEADRARKPHVRQLDDDISRLARSVGIERYPTWKGPTTSDIIADLKWLCDPDVYSTGHGWAFDSTLIYPFPGARYTDRYAFRYLLPRGAQRGVLYRASGHEHADLKKRDYIMWECAQRATEEYRGPVLAILAAERRAEQERIAAKAELERFAARFKASVEADAKAVIETIRAGGQAKLRDWLTIMRPPEALYHSLVQTVADAAGNVESARREAEWAREAAVRDAERRVTEERELASARLLSGPIPLSGIVPGSIVLGTRVKTGDTYLVDLRKLRHLFLSGVSGAGKSVLLHEICWQMVELPEFDKIIAIDLKGGIEFAKYRNSGKVEVVWDFDNGDVGRAVEGLMQLADKRQTYMRENGMQNWPMQNRVALVIDEFAEVQSAIDTATEKEEKARAKRLATNLVSLARRARALGIHIVIAAQRHTTDSIDSALLNNLNWRLVMRQGARHTARALLDIDDDFSRLSVLPTELPTGRFYAYDTSSGDLKLLQAHIAPGVELS